MQAQCWVRSSDLYCYLVCVCGLLDAFYTAQMDLACCSLDLLPYFIQLNFLIIIYHLTRHGNKNYQIHSWLWRMRLHTGSTKNHNFQKKNLTQG